MSEKDAKERILKAAKALMDETDDLESVTMRQIAQRAGVGVGLINYHFQSRENLLYTAIGEVMISIMDAFRQTPPDGATPAERLKDMMTALCDAGARHEKEMRLGSQFQIMSGDFSAAHYLLPALREACGQKYDENALRLIALQLFTLTNLMMLRSDAFFRFSGADIMNKPQRDRLISQLIDIYL